MHLANCFWGKISTLLSILWIKKFTTKIFSYIWCLFSITLHWQKHSEDQKYGTNFAYYVVKLDSPANNIGKKLHPILYRCLFCHFFEFFPQYNSQKNCINIFDFSVKSFDDLSIKERTEKRTTLKSSYRWSNLTKTSVNK